MMRLKPDSIGVVFVKESFEIFQISLSFELCSRSCAPAPAFFGSLVFRHCFLALFSSPLPNHPDSLENLTSQNNII